VEITFGVTVAYECVAPSVARAVVIHRAILAKILIDDIFPFRDAVIIPLYVFQPGIISKRLD
jgi:hypothetical protein